jgi:hypothetical protein
MDTQKPVSELTAAELQSLVDDIRNQRCAGPCNRVLPLTSECFHKDRTTESGFMEVCKECRSLERKNERLRTVELAVNKLNEKALESILDTLEDGTDSKGLQHIAATFEEIIHVFGGARIFAKHVVSQYLACGAGSAGRTKLLTLLLNIQMRLSESGHATIEADELSDEQLAEQLEKARLKLHQPKIASNAS